MGSFMLGLQFRGFPKSINLLLNMHVPCYISGLFQVKSQKIWNIILVLELNSEIVSRKFSTFADKVTIWFCLACSDGSFSCDTLHPVNWNTWLAHLIRSDTMDLNSSFAFGFPGAFPHFCMLALGFVLCFPPFSKNSEHWEAHGDTR